MTDYGVVPTGFNRKSFNTILREIENSMITEFGGNVVMTPQSPFGQINGLFAMTTTILWEFAEDIYQSYDVDQAEGTRLNILAKIRLMERMIGESDADFRKAITNQGRARIDVQDLTRAVTNVDGVWYCHVWVNDTTEIDQSTGLPGGSLCVAVLGGDDAEIGLAIRRFVAPGISLYGNTYIVTVAEGYCRTLVILRPSVVPIELIVYVQVRRDVYGCPPPSLPSMRDALVDALAPGGSHQLLNGDDITHYRIRSVVESLFPNVEVIGIAAAREEDEGEPQSGGLPIAFMELATVDAENVQMALTVGTVGA
jgi:hypothetical protein